MHAKHGRASKFIRRTAFGALMVAIAAVALQGCYRGHGHDPERIDKRMDWIQEEIADDLEIRPDQQAAYDTLMGDVRAFSKTRIEGWRETMKQLKVEFEKPNRMWNGYGKLPSSASRSVRAARNWKFWWIR